MKLNENLKMQNSCKYKHRQLNETKRHNCGNFVYNSPNFSWNF